MKYLILSALLLICTENNLSAQLWTPHWQSGDFQFSTNFFDGESFGYVAFENFFFRLNDHGNSWTSAYYEDIKKFVCIDFQDTQNGWAIMEDQSTWSVRETNDGGQSWIQHGDLPDGFGNFYIVEALDDNNILAATNSRVFRSTDAGETWSEVLFLGDGITGIYFQNANTVWTSGGNGKVHRSINAGLNWSLININVTTYGVTDIQFSDTGNIYALIGGGYSGIRKSENNGSSWTDIPTGIINQAMLVQTDNTILVSSLSGIYRTINGGGSWNNLYSWPQNRSTYHFYNTSTSEIILAGFGGQIYRTQNNGTAWTEINSGFNYVTGIDVLNSAEAYAIGAFGFSPGLMHTSNGGENWHLMTAPSVVSAIDFVDPLTGFAIGSAGLSKTTDGGQSWTIKNATITSGKIVALDAMNIHVLSNNMIVHNSFDGGETWGTGNYNVALPLVVFPLYDMEFTNTMNGRLSGDSGYIYYTSDGGINWIKNTTLATSIDLPECFYLNSSIGWHSTQDILYKTTNGGANWSTINIPSLMGYLSSLHFYDASHGMGVDSFGGEFRLMETTNGGSNWTDVTPPYITTQSLGTIWRSTDDIGFIGSPDLGILRKDNSLCPLPVFVATLQVENPQACIGGTGFISFDTEASFEGVEWYKDGILLSTNTTLIILNVDAQDTGTYECHITDSNECGTYDLILYANFTAIENIAPTLSISSTEYDLCEGGSFELTAETSYGTISSALWYQGENYIGQGNPFIVSNVEGFQSGIYTSYVIVSSVCGSFNIESESIEITILDNYSIYTSAPQFIDPYCEGFSLELPVSAFGYPVISYVWTINDVVVSTDPTLYIESLSASDSGTLSVSITGSGGCASEVDTYSWDLSILALPEVFPPTSEYQTVYACIGETIDLIFETDHPAAAYEWYFNGSYIGTGQTLPIGIVSEYYFGDYYGAPYYGNECTYISEWFLLYTILPGDNIEITPTESETILAPCGEDLYFGFTANVSIDSYEWIHNNEVIGINQTLVVSLGEHYYGQFYCHVTSSNNCGSAEETFLMYNVVESEPYPLTYSLTSEYVTCEGFPSEISVDASTVFPGVVEYSWIDNGEILGTGPSISSAVLELGFHEIELIMSVMWNCGISQTFEYVNILVEEGPEFPVELNLQSIDVCDEDNITLECDIAIPGAEMTYTWFHDGIELSDGTSLLVNVNSESDGVYSCLVTAIASCGIHQAEYNLFELIVSFNPTVDPFFSDLILSGCSGDMIEMEYLTEDEPYLVEWFLNNELIFSGTNYNFEATEESSGEYYVYAYAANDCGTDETANVLMYTLTIDSNLELPEDPGPTELSICEGPIELSFEPEIDGATYDWYSEEGYLASGQMIIVDQPVEGLFTCDVSISNNCSALSFIYQYLTLEIVAPSTPLITIDDYMWVEEDFETYEWTFNGTIVGLTDSIPIMGNGEYGLTVTNEFGCSNTQTIHYTSTEESIQEFFNLYPNPASDFTIVDSPVPVNSIIIYNALGEPITTRMNISEGKVLLQTSELASGVYILEVNFDGNKQERKQLMVTH